MKTYMTAAWQEASDAMEDAVDSEPILEDAMRGLALHAASVVLRSAKDHGVCVGTVYFNFIAVFTEYAGIANAADVESHAAVHKH